MSTEFQERLATTRRHAIAFLLKRMVRRMVSRPPEWEYGTCRLKLARRNRKTGAVQFVLWKAGEQGHAEDYWHDFDSSWWPAFIPAQSNDEAMPDGTNKPTQTL